MWSYLWKYIHIVLKSIYILKKDVVAVVVDMFGVVAVVAVNVFVTVVIHYNDVIMDEIASQITSLTIVYSIVYSDADQRKPQSSASLTFVWGIHRDRWIPRTNGQLRGKCFHLMTSSWRLAPLGPITQMIYELVIEILWKFLWLYFWF